MEGALNDTSIELNEATWAHCLYTIMKSFVDQVEHTENK